MKKFTLLLAGLAIVSFSFGQVLQKAQDALSMQERSPISLEQSSFKAGGDTIWSETFDWADETQERGWTLPDGWIIADNTDFGMPWKWSKDTIGGKFSKLAPPSFFDTEENGFIVAPIDQYNTVDGEALGNACDTYIQTPSIDCSNSPSVLVNLHQYFRLCCNNYNLEMLVTNDGGVHWALYDLRYGVGGNATPTAKNRSPQINISDVAAGMPDVQIKFYMHGPSHYYWLIDDLVLTEAYENDLVLEDTWTLFNSGFDVSTGHINYVPLSQIGAASPIAGNLGGNDFQGVLLNNGMLDQENAHINVTVLKNGSEILSENSEPGVIWPLERDTQMVVNSFQADDYGDYQFNYTAVSDNSEEVPGNNTFSNRFTVNDTLYHRADFSAEASSGGGGWVDGNTAGDMVGVAYDILEPCEISSITARIAGVTDAQSPIYQFVIFKEVEGEFEEWIATDVYPADSTKVWTWQTHVVEKDGESEYLEAGHYAVCVRMWGDDGTELGKNGMSIGWDKDTKWNGSYSLFWNNVRGEWWGIDKLNQVGFNVNATGGPTEAPATFNVDMNAHIANGEFFPGSDFMDISGSFNDWSASEHMTDEDGDGIYSLTVTGLSIASVIEYKYRINGNWDTSEYPAGGPNRTYTIRYWNIINNVYNSGETTGIEDIALIENLTVFPNPTQGDITVRFSTKNATDIAISLMDIQGHVVYLKEINGVINHTETIENNFAKGVYFLTVNNGREVKVQKLIIQ